LLDDFQKEKMALVKDFQYTDKLLFEDKELLTFIKENQNPGMKSIALGTIYHMKIVNPSPPPVETVWIGEEVGVGIFAKEEISADMLIGEYTGIVRRCSSQDPPNDYSFIYPVEDSIGRYLEIDAKKWGNFTRHINHSYNPNIETVSAYIKGVHHVILLSSRVIKKGEQLTFDYGESYWSKRTGLKVM
jgi:hypothetical protein